MIERLGVNQFYTIPSVLRALMAKDQDVPKQFNLQSLRIIGSGTSLKVTTYVTTLCAN